jgi:hypothetical protein
VADAFRPSVVNAARRQLHHDQSYSSFCSHLAMTMTTRPAEKEQSFISSSSRRSFVEDLAVSSLMVATAAVGFCNTREAAWASGGATAGGVYLLSVRMRARIWVLAW